jgi:hypothetical protein
MRRLGAVALLVACQQEPPTVTPTAVAHNPCADYRRALAGALGEHGSVAIEVRNACGCPITVQTTAERAAELRIDFARVTSAKLPCSVNCDEPCSTPATASP